MSRSQAYNLNIDKTTTSKYDDVDKLSNTIIDNLMYMLNLKVFTCIMF